MVEILIIDDEETICKSLKWTLKSLGHDVSYVLNFDEGKKMILAKDFALFFVDLILPGGSGIDLVILIRDKSKESIIIIISNCSTIINIFCYISYICPTSSIC